MAIFGTKSQVNPLGKMSIFRLFKLLVFIAQKGVISFYNFVNAIFLAFIAQKKKFGKMAIFDQNHGLTPWEKCQLFDYLNFLFLQPRKAFLLSRTSLRIFSLPILPEKKSWKNGHFWTKTMGLTPLEKSQFFDFLNFLFLQPRKAYFRSRIS